MVFRSVCTIFVIKITNKAMSNKEPGYVYILTNPSFREDWVKIGKSSRPVDVRSKELDNTAVPLPFEIFATMKAKNNKAVQGIVAVSDAEQIEKIRKEVESLDDIKKEIKYWDYTEVLEVHEALQKVNESINKLGLVPVSL